MILKRRFLSLILIWLTTLACSTMTEQANLSPTSEIVTPTTVPTPTLAPSATPPPTVSGPATAIPTHRPFASPTATEVAVGPGLATCPAGGDNLLVNPGFEGDFRFQGGQEVLVAPGWVAWWVQGSDTNLRPEFKQTNIGNRVHSGSSAQQYFKSFGQYVAGVYQVVENEQLRPGTRVQFSAYGQGWSCIQGADCGAGVSVDPANMFMRVGIDPTGNTDPDSRTVKWSGYFNPIDRYEIQCVETVAESNQIVVFTWASPDQPRLNQDSYWDDGALVIIP